MSNKDPFTVDHHDNIVNYYNRGAKRLLEQKENAIGYRFMDEFVQQAIEQNIKTIDGFKNLAKDLIKKYDGDSMNLDLREEIFALYASYLIVSKLASEDEVVESTAKRILRSGAAENLADAIANEVGEEIAVRAVRTMTHTFYIASLILQIIAEELLGAQTLFEWMGIGFDAAGTFFILHIHITGQDCRKGARLLGTHPEVIETVHRGVIMPRPSIAALVLDAIVDAKTKKNEN